MTSLLVLQILLVLPPPTISEVRSDLEFIWNFTSSEQAFTALVNDELDILCMDLTREQKEAVEANPDLQITACAKNDYYEFAVNNNRSIPSYPNALSPTNVREVRQALSCLVNKSYIISNILDGFGARIDQPIPYRQTEGWCDPSVITYDWNHNGVIEPDEANYPWEYNLTKAVLLLAGVGFADTDDNGYLNYPDNPAWGNVAGNDTTQMPLRIVAIQECTYRREAARYLYSQLEGDPTVAGDSPLADEWARLYAEGKVSAPGGDFATTALIGPRSVIAPIILQLDFHIYVRYIKCSRFPLHLYFLYHSAFWGASNIVTDYEHPELDVYLEKLYYAPDLVQAQAASKNACRYMALNAVTIPLWSTMTFQTWRKEVCGIVNMVGYGINNKYTYINAYRADAPEQPLRIGIYPPPAQLNPVYSNQPTDWEILNAMYTHLMNFNPYDLAVDQPWVAQDWEVETWVDPRDGREKTAVTCWIRKDAGIGTPNPTIRLRSYTAHDVEFTIWYYYAFQDGWNWPFVKDVSHTKIIDDYTIKIYFNNLSIWLLYSIGTEMPLLCKYELIDVLSTAPNYPLLSKKTESFIYWGEPVKLQHSVVQVINATADGIPIQECEDFHIYADPKTYCHNVFVLTAGIEPPVNITITYWYAPNPPTGIFLGSDAGLNWQDTMYTPAPHYADSINIGTGASLKKNPNFFLSPILGELDWRWYWEGETKPRSGYYRIDILDVVLCTGSYCQRGDGVYNPLYFPGADLDANDLCHVGILDLVIVTGNYFAKFGTPPADP